MAGLGAHGGFTPNRTLLNPKFENYKLHPWDQAAVVSAFSLPGGVAAPTVSTQIHLAFPEVANRVRHNHLALGFGSRVVFISSSYEVVGVEIVTVTDPPVFFPIAKLPVPAEPEAPLHLEYPVAIAVSPDTLVVSDGGGRLYVIRAGNAQATSRAAGEILAIFRLATAVSTKDGQTPFRLHYARLSQSGILHCILSVTERSASTLAGSVGASSNQKTTFDLLNVRVHVPDQAIPDVVELHVEWRISGKDLPLFFAHDPASTRYIIGSPSPLVLVQPPDSSTSSETEAAPEDIAPIPRADENLDGAAATQVKKPPPYSWTQTPDSVTVVFPLPSSTPKSSIRVLLTARDMTLLVADRGNQAIVSLPVYVKKPLWDGIRSDTSYWKWDKEGEGGDSKSSSVGLLSLYLDKQNEDTKWPHVFAAVGTGTGLEEDEEVPETVDPSELWHVREALEKYTAALTSGEDASGLGLGTGLSSLNDNEMDDEIDFRVGVRVVLSYVSEDGQPSCPAPMVPVDLLSSSFASSVPPSAVIKHTLDGLLFTIPGDEGAVPSYEWQHTATYPALAFVLASKQDTKFVYHYGPDVVLAFEGGSSDGRGSGNVFIYCGARGARSAKQTVLRVSGGSAGALMGVQAVPLSDGNPAIVCLCEREIVIIRDILTWATQDVSSDDH